MIDLLIGLAKVMGIFVLIALAGAAVFGWFERRSKRKGKYSDKAKTPYH